MDQAWKDEVLSRLKANKAAKVEPGSIAALAAIAGVTPAALSVMLKRPGDSNTRVLPQINLALGLAAPAAFTVDQSRAFVMSNWNKLTPDDHLQIRQLVEHLARRK